VTRRRLFLAAARALMPAQNNFRVSFAFHVDIENVSSRLEADRAATLYVYQKLVGQFGVDLPDSVKVEFAKTVQSWLVR